MSMNLTDELERSFGQGPPEPPLEDLLTHGRRALRRRRLATGAASTALAAVVLGGALLTTGGDGPEATRPPVAGTSPTAPASPPTSAAPASPEPKPFPSQGPLRQTLMTLAEYDGDGQLSIDPRATIRRQLDNPYRVASPGDSVALELEYDGYRMWFAMVLRPDDSSSGTSLAWTSELTFDDFVDAQAGLATLGASSDGGWPGIPDLDVVGFDGDSEVLLATGGATILAQRGGVDVGASFAGPDDQTAAAKVRAADGAVYYVLARRLGQSPAQYIAVAVAYGGPDLASFLDVARSRYAEGGGGLL